jgi:hypothetical protein
LCKKQCGVNIEAAHIIDEAAGGSNEEENGIPLCFDCHQEIGSYNEKHPRGNKLRPAELKARRNRVYELVAQGKLDTLLPANLPQLFERRIDLMYRQSRTSNPTIADVLTAVNGLAHTNWDNAYMILEDRGWENAFAQVCIEPNLLFWAEYRDGATQLQYRSRTQITIEVVRFIMLTYAQHGDSLMRLAVDWENVTASIRK